MKFNFCAIISRNVHTLHGQASRAGDDIVDRRIISILMLFTTSFIWGSSFVAQIFGMQYIGPFTFCAVRYLVSALVMVPVALAMDSWRGEDMEVHALYARWRSCLKSGVICGWALFFATGLQQIGLLFTGAGKTAFITTLYIIIVPIYGIFAGKKLSKTMVIAVAMCLVGLYLLTIKGDFSIGPGDAFVLAGAFFWAAHIVVSAKFVRGLDAVKLSTIQFATVAVISSIPMFALEMPKVQALIWSWLPIFYASVISTGIAYTFQMAAQRYVPPVAASLVLSTEALFAAIFGFIMLGERFTAPEAIGATILLAGTLIAQIRGVNSQS